MKCRVQCCKADAIHGKKSCERHLARERARVRPKKSGDEVKVINARIRVRRAVRKAKGQCLNCSLAASPNRKMCEKHLQYNNDRSTVSRYKLPNVEFLHDMKLAQNNRCLLCGELFDSAPRTRWAAVDHDHETGVIRGLLHQNCNLGLGLFEEDADKLRMVAKYVEEICNVSAS